MSKPGYFKPQTQTQTPFLPKIGIQTLHLSPIIHMVGHFTKKKKKMLQLHDIWLFPAEI